MLWKKEHSRKKNALLFTLFAQNVQNRDDNSSKIRLALGIDFCLLWPSVQYSKTRVALI